MERLTWPTWVLMRWRRLIFMTSPRTDYTSNVISYGIHTLNADSVNCSSILYISRHVVCHEYTTDIYSINCTVYAYFMKVFMIKALQAIERRGSQGDSALSMIFSTSVAVDISDLSNHSTDVEISVLFLHVSLSLLKWLPKFIYLQYRYM